MNEEREPARPEGFLSKHPKAALVALVVLAIVVTVALLSLRQDPVVLYEAF